MAQINFNNIQSSDNSTSNSVGFFQLKNDGDEAIVRFAHDTVDSFELLTTHDVSYNGKFRKVNCVRNPQEPLENCPLCAKGQKISQRIFIHLVQYVQDETGKIVALPKVWDRPVTYAYKLKSLIEEYGPLTDSVFKIKRHGAAGSRETSYDILFCNPAMYDSNIYPKNFNAFDNYKSLGVIVMDKSFDELLTFATTGVFPETPKTEQNVTTTPNVVPNTIPTNYASVNTASYTPVRDNMVSGQFGNQNPFMQNGAVENNMSNMYNNTQSIQRPVRSYN